MNHATAATRSGPRSSPALRAVYASPTPSERPVEQLSYTDVRARYVLVEHRHERDEDALVITLRLDHAERSGTRDELRCLGFEPNASPARSAITWRRPLRGTNLARLGAFLRETLGDEVALDLGATFVDDGRDALADATPADGWPGRRILHVGGTRRCVVFAADVDPADLARAFDESRDDYFANDFHPATE
jgi:hypothetical protein